MMKKHILFEVCGRIILAACLFVGLSAMLFEINKDEIVKIEPMTVSNIELKDPLDAELIWCRHLGDEALRDKECLRAWSENRARFFKRDKTGVASKQATNTFVQSADMKRR